MYRLIKQEGRAKRGEFTTVHGVIQTPVFMNVGTVAAIKGAVATTDLQQIGTQIELSNTYHLHVRPGDKIVRQMGGLHKFMNWDRPKIAGVIENRLNTGMKLQIDATVVYAISDGMYDVNRVYYKDLEVDSPYNTYKYNGLPVGPIASPGLKSIEAALNPEKHDYFYYRTDSTKNDGSHVFSKDFEEHKAADK